MIIESQDPRADAILGVIVPLSQYLLLITPSPSQKEKKTKAKMFKDIVIE